MSSPLITRLLTKAFHAEGGIALDALTLELPAGRIVGLLGRNGAGKSTLLNVACGLMLPTRGTCLTFGQPSGELEAHELARLGFVAQQNRFLEWMTVAQQLRLNASFYPRWDPAREQRLLSDLELDPHRKIVHLSVGDQQKLGVILAVCHHPELLLLDEPMSALDPIVRATLMTFLVELLREDGATIVVSSHLLSDVEKLVDWIVCLDRGRLAVSTSLDDLQETYAEWVVTSLDARLPARFPEPWVLAREGDARHARLYVRVPAPREEAQFASAYGARITRHTTNLERLFPLLIQERRAAA